MSYITCHFLHIICNICNRYLKPVPIDIILLLWKTFRSCRHWIFRPQIAFSGLKIYKKVSKIIELIFFIMLILQFFEPDLSKGFLYPKLENVHAGTMTSNPSGRHEILISVKSSFPMQISHKINPGKIRNLKNQFIFSIETFELFNLSLI